MSILLKPLSDAYLISQPILQAIDLNLPLVALESAVITHGLPRPENLNLARALEADVRAKGANPATVALLDGKVRVGLTETELERLANMDGTRKISPARFRDCIG